MPRGTVDFCTSRRTEENECEYWIAQDGVPLSLDEKKLNNLCDGTFFASEVNLKSDEYQVVAQEFMFESSNLTLKTNDDIHDITENSVVKYDNELWRVKDVQRLKIKKHSYFCVDSTYSYYITLRR